MQSFFNSKYPFMHLDDNKYFFTTTKQYNSVSSSCIFDIIDFYIKKSYIKNNIVNINIFNFYLYENDVLVFYIDDWYNTTPFELYLKTFYLKWGSDRFPLSNIDDSILFLYKALSYINDGEPGMECYEHNLILDNLDLKYIDNIKNAIINKTNLEIFNGCIKKNDRCYTYIAIKI